MGGVVYAILQCLADIHSKGLGDYVVLMSESDYPLKSPEYINHYLQSHFKDYIITTPLPHPNPLNTPDGHWIEGGRRRLECWPVKLNSKMIASIEPLMFNFGNARQFAKVLRYNPRKLVKALKVFFMYPDRRHPNYLRPCGGELWFGMRMSTVAKVLDYCKAHPDFLEYHKNTIVSDEIILPTLINHLVAENERENSTLRYISWPKGGSFSPIDLTESDEHLLADCIANPNYLYVRKVQDMAVCRLIDRLTDETRV